MNKILKVFTVLVLVLISTGTFAQEAKFMSAFLYQFGRIMDFPAKGDSFVIGIYGDSPVSGYLEKIADIKTINDQKIIVRKISSAGEASKCQILFIPQNGSNSLDEIKGLVSGKGTLIVTEETDLIKKGAGVSFVKVGDKILFELNKESIGASGLKSSLSLERIAHKVY